MRQRLTATPTLVKIYSDLFVNRRAYTLQSMRPHLKAAVIITIARNNASREPRCY